MKKFVLVLIMLLLSTSGCFAYDIDLTKDGQYQKKVMEIGFNILNANRIEKRIIFKYSNDKQANAFANYNDKSVLILRGLFPYIEDDSELAGIISHEIAHNVDYYGGGFFRYLAMVYSSKKYEEKADKKAVDYMVKAGYNPVALIVIFNKFSGEMKSSSHPLTSQRLTYIYEYIYQKYPTYLVQNDYRENIYYQNFLLTSRDAREKIRNKNNNINVSDKKTKKM